MLFILPEVFLREADAHRCAAVARLAEQIEDVPERFGVLEYVAEQFAQRFGAFLAHFAGPPFPPSLMAVRAFWARVWRMPCCPARCRSALVGEQLTALVVCRERIRLTPGGVQRAHEQGTGGQLPRMIQHGASPYASRRGRL